jgi:hypothetical protein
LLQDLVLKVAEDFVNLRVVLNGGVKSAEEVALHASGSSLAGVMAGRWMLRRPFDLFAVDYALNSQGRADDHDEATRRSTAILSYVEYARGELNYVSRDEGVAVLAPIAIIWLSLWSEYRSYIDALDSHGQCNEVAFMKCEYDSRLLMKSTRPIFKDFFRFDTDKFSQELVASSSLGREPPFKSFGVLLESALGKKIIGKMKKNCAENYSTQDI